MSFVQATDGRFYENPVLWGDGWYASFVADDPEIVVAVKYRRATCRSRASKALRDAGIEAKDLRRSSDGTRFFPPEMSMMPSCGYVFKLLAPIPVPEKHDTVVDEPGAVWDNCIHGFYSDVSAMDCARAVLGLDVSPLISRALLATAFYMKEGGIRAEVNKKLFAQVPWLRELKIDRYVEQLREHPEIVRINWRVA